MPEARPLWSSKIRPSSRKDGGVSKRVSIHHVARTDSAVANRIHLSDGTMRMAIPRFEDGLILISAVRINPLRTAFHAITVQGWDRSRGASRRSFTCYAGEMLDGCFASLSSLHEDSALTPILLRSAPFTPFTGGVIVRVGDFLRGAHFFRHISQVHSDARPGG